MISLGTANVAPLLFCLTASIPLCPGTEQSANVTIALIWDKCLRFENIVLIGYRVQEVVRHFFCFNKTCESENEGGNTKLFSLPLYHSSWGSTDQGTGWAVSEGRGHTAMPHTTYKEKRGPLKVKSF